MKKGFTLIELLAVIVILAIIALIATPIVIDIISDTKESALLRSAEFYLSGVEFSIASAKLNNRTIKDGEYNILENGNICLKYEDDNKTCKDILEVEVNGDKPNSGVITVTNGELRDISLNLGNKDIVKNDKGELLYSPCKRISGDRTTPGSLYKCEVSPGVKYNFYVLSQENNGTTNLIMDRNICSDGTLTDADKTDKCLVNWQSSGTNKNGPVTAMDYLYTATKYWINIPNIEIDYKDEGNTGSYGYGSIKTVNGLTQMTKKDGTILTVLTNKDGYTNLKARLPRYNELYGEGKCLTTSGSCPLWLVNYLRPNGYIVGEEVKNINDIGGYWTLASYTDYAGNAWYVYHGGYLVNYGVNQGTSNGVRPVINVNL